MSTVSSVGAERKTRIEGFPADSARFDLLIALFVSMLVMGLFLDGWAHNHGRVDNTFFTPWHAVLYGSYALTAGTLAVTQLINVSKGYRFTHALPRGYGLALVGAVIFGFSGGFDFVWHSLFGFEVGIEPLLSPAHLALALGGLLMITSPLRAAWGRKNVEVSWRTMLPSVIALTAILAVLTFFTQYAHPLTAPEVIINSESNMDQIFGFFGVYTQAVLVMGTLLLALKRWGRLPVGAVTVILTVNVALFYWLRWGELNGYLALAAAPILAGIVGDTLLVTLRPSPARVWAIRVFSAAVPLVMFIAHFVLMMTFYGISWTIHLWLGAAIIAATIGVFLSYLAFLPAMDELTG
jgi:hypothetical protein